MTRDHYKGVPKGRSALSARRISNLNTVSGTSLYGDGRDGDLVVTAGTTTLTRDGHYNNITVEQGATLHTDGFRLSVTDNLVVRGFLGWTARNASGSTRGNIDFDANRTLGVGGSVATDGRDGGTGDGDGGGSPFASLGGAGGAGGNSGGNTGGATRDVTTLAENEGSFVALSVDLPYGYLPGGIDRAVMGGAPGAASGAGDGSNAGGGGGASAGIVVVAARNIKVGSHGAIAAVAGKGGDGTAGNAAGGGGGGGGIVFVLCDIYSGPLPTAAGGQSGLGKGIGEDGEDGGAGTVVLRTLQV